MIERIAIKNFKSLAEVHLDLAHFNCLIGMNGAGKSSVLQALDFLTQLMRGGVQGWLDDRGWSISDLHCKLRKESNIGVGVAYRSAAGQKLRWTCQFNRTLMRCTSERILLGTDVLLRVDGPSFTVAGKAPQDISFTYEGSVLSALKDSELPPEVLEFRDALRATTSLELLSPHLLRKRARSTEKSIGSGGERLSAFLGTIQDDEKATLLDLLRKFYPQVVDFKVSSLRSGWKKLSVFERFGDKLLETEAAHLNDGLLRILAVLTQAGSNRSMILLDEIENGINQEVVEALVDTLVTSRQQVLVTTHSPLILNFLDDDVARKAVHFIYKTPQGESRIRPFFAIPRINEKLRSMGPGDAFVDTDLRELSAECVMLDEDALDEAIAQAVAEQSGAARA